MNIYFWAIQKCVDSFLLGEMKEIFSFDEFFYDKKVDFNFSFGGNWDGNRRFSLKIEGEASWRAFFDKNFGKKLKG